jgi:hypothetical protein
MRSMAGWSHTRGTKHMKLHNRRRTIVPVVAVLALSVVAHTSPQPRVVASLRDVAAAAYAPRIASAPLSQPRQKLELNLVDHFGGAVTGAKGDGNRLILSIGRKLEVRDVSDPDQPHLIRRVGPIPPDSSIVALAGDLALVVEVRRFVSTVRLSASTSALVRWQKSWPNLTHWTASAAGSRPPSGVRRRPTPSSGAPP